ncbi:hypothetical protein [Curtobacterium sp. 9128]|uniref:hypothetical protein n=1 Tax=Curtobacterium sp. 9128 TaxID=1793722 RepID=UPI0011A319D9|nr:hypothetical protein [Curtobacterium sp. 9128]
MSEGVVSTGIRVYRERRREFTDPARARRRTLVCGLVAVLAGATTVVTDLLTGWLGTTLPVTVVTVVTATAFAAALGWFVAVCFPTARTRQSARWQPFPGGWRRHERLGAQFTRRPPELLPEDRDDVLALAERVVEPTVVSIDRLRWFPLAWLAAWIGALVSGLAAGSVGALLMPPAYLLLSGGTVVAGVVRLGQAELVRRRVAATPPWAPPAAGDPRSKTRVTGSKLALPGD